jgi:uncharacterized surface anchored protein
MALFAFMYFLETSEGKILSESSNKLDDIIKNIHKCSTEATHYRVKIIDENKNMVLYTRTEPLPDFNNIHVRMAFNLDNHIY